jgi:hypothetical protein
MSGGVKTGGCAPAATVKVGWEMLDPSSFPIIGPGAPYINPAILTAASTGISWDTIPDRDSNPDQQYAEQINMCARATASIDEYCNQPLRATIDVEQLTGPGEFRYQQQSNGNARLLLSRSPVTAVIGGRISSAQSFPQSWNTIPANQFRVEKTLIGVYGTTAPGTSGGGGQSVIMSSGYGGWWFGRLSNLVEVTYLNGWPHAAISTAVTAGTSTLAVDDVTGWLGAVGIIYGQALQESILCIGVTPTTTGAISGPGTLTLAQPLSFTHQVGDIVSCLPQSVQWAAILYCVVQALTRGATSTAVQSLGGGVSGSGGLSPGDLTAAAEKHIHAYKRTI